MSLYPFLCRSVPVLLGRTSTAFLHNGNIEKENFEGRLACGATCYMLHYYLEEHFDITTQMMLKKRGNLDHCFLAHGDVIFDPTYRQFIPRVKWFPSFMYVGNAQRLEEHCEMHFWSGASVSPELMDARQVMTDREYAVNKGLFFKKLYDTFH